MSVQMLSAEELLGLDKFNVDDGNSHIVLDPARCAACKEKPCLYICSAVCYKLAAEAQVVQFDYAGCLECGTCRVVCRNLGNSGVIRWEYPRPTFGVSFRYG